MASAHVDGPTLRSALRLANGERKAKPHKPKPFKPKPGEFPPSETEVTRTDLECARLESVLSNFGQDVGRLEQRAADIQQRLESLERQRAAASRMFVGAALLAIASFVPVLNALGRARAALRLFGRLRAGRDVRARDLAALVGFVGGLETAVAAFGQLRELDAEAERLRNELEGLHDESERALFHYRANFDTYEQLCGAPATS